MDLPPYSPPGAQRMGVDLVSELTLAFCQRRETESRRDTPLLDGGSPRPDLRG
ncbi:MAG: hypothetical protein L3K23_01640 [Thermoplasmata archaeon]|nr:hypothetical protein [Thermoplasmata archaeon]